MISIVDVRAPGRVPRRLFPRRARSLSPRLSLRLELRVHFVVLLQRRGVHRVVHLVHELKPLQDLDHPLFDRLPLFAAALRVGRPERRLRDLPRGADEAVEILHGFLEAIGDAGVHEVRLDPPHRLVHVHRPSPVVAARAPREHAALAPLHAVEVLRHLLVRDVRDAGAQVEGVLVAAVPLRHLGAVVERVHEPGRDAVERLAEHPNEGGLVVECLVLRRVVAHRHVRELRRARGERRRAEHARLGAVHALGGGEVRARHVGARRVHHLEHERGGRLRHV